MVKAPAFLFLDALAAHMPPSQRLILCGFKGDPDTAEPRDWRPRPWSPADEGLPFGRRDNAYVTVSSFGQAPDGTYRRRGDTFAAGHALMVDDVGTKVPRATVAALPPSAVIETSPGNEQHWYFLETPEPDRLRFDSVIRAFISSNLLGNDPGMSGVTRVGRLPGFTNGKPRHAGFVCAMHKLEPAARYSIPALVKAFRLELAGRPAPLRTIPTDVARDRIKAFFAISRFLDHRNMFKRETSDLSGWREMHCPWMDDHSNNADTGAAIREPAPDNGHYGAFRCHHGHCQSRGWRDLTEWAADAAADELEPINAAAPVSLTALLAPSRKDTR